MSRILNRISQIFSRNPQGDMSHVFNAIDDAINTVSNDLILLNLQFDINTATGEWLDEYGNWFGIPRKPEESDSGYSSRMIVTISKPKSTIQSLIDTTREYLKDPDSRVKLEEMYEKVRRYSQASFSGTHRFTDGEYYRAGAVNITTSGGVNPELYETIDHIRASGVRLTFTQLYEALLNLKWDLVASPNTIKESITVIPQGVLGLSSDTLQEIQMNAHLSILITAGSDIILLDVWEDTIEEVANMQSHTIAIETETISI